MTPTLVAFVMLSAAMAFQRGVCGGKPDVIPYKTESVVYIRPRLSRRQYRQLEPKVCGRVTGVASHVYYGEGAQRGDYPWMALIKIPTIIDGSQVIQGCGGTVISRYFVLTAAHCTQDHPVYGKIIVSVGDVDTESGNRLQTYRVPYDHVTAHPGYRPDDQTVKNDLALIRMDKPFNFSDHIRPICLPSSKLNLTDARADVAGWGISENSSDGSSRMQKGVVKVINEKCKHSFYNIDRRQICAEVLPGESRTCMGDSGGPLMYRSPMDGRYYIVGIVSYGEDASCQDVILPDVFTRVSYYVDWIHSVVSRKHV
ncbi:CLIP domain-containing serine protease HP8-like [Periplaneta americana]|uniref:CLIP domain-containing serine protease HP8-like n=1 Tax=Periplaneta americana TaxID=6978 RepID=UPI0037E7409B